MTEGVVIFPGSGEEDRAILLQRVGLDHGAATANMTHDAKRENGAEEEESIARVIGVARDKELEILKTRRL